MFHKLAHLFGLYSGRVVTWYWGEDLMVGFQCYKCGNIEGVHKSLVQWAPKEEHNEVV